MANWLAPQLSPRQSPAEMNHEVRNLCSIVNVDDFKLTLSRPDFAKAHVLVNGKTMARDSMVLSHHDRICSLAEAVWGRKSSA
eukprot:Skav227761  [mRNA]  locus=scaffold1653:225506:225754:- [translate_table: standard]